MGLDRRYAACLFLFAGTAFALYMIQKLGNLRSKQLFLLVFGACFLTDAIALAVDPTPTDYNIASLASRHAFALGGQNLLSQKSGVIKANTTFMTGNIQKMVEAAWNAWQKRKRAACPRRTRGVRARLQVGLLRGRRRGRRVHGVV